MNRNVMIGIIVLVVIILGGMLVMRNSQPDPEMNTPEESKMAAPTDAMTEEGTPTGMEDESDSTVKEFTVTGSNFKFNPATLSVKKGDTVKITFKSENSLHDFVIDEFNVATKQLPDGEEEVIEFTADQAGKFEYYCSVGSHRAMGMVGTLTVTE